MWKVLLAAGFMASPALAQDNATVVPGFSGQGAGAWEMICHVVVGGDQREVILGPSRTRFESQSLQRASCTYHASARGDLVVTINAAATCPFRGASEGACTTTLQRSHPGSFEFRVRNSR